MWCVFFEAARFQGLNAISSPAIGEILAPAYLWVGPHRDLVNLKTGGGSPNALPACFPKRGALHTREGWRAVYRNESLPM
jgi:hypothetical protein